MFENLELTFGGGAPVAAHGGENEGAGPELLEVVHDAPDDDRDIGNAAAARPHGHDITALDGQVRLGHGRADTRGDVHQTLAGEALPHPVHHG